MAAQGDETHDRNIPQHKLIQKSRAENDPKNAINPYKNTWKINKEKHTQQTTLPNHQNNSWSKGSMNRDADINKRNKNKAINKHMSKNPLKVYGKNTLRSNYSGGEEGDEIVYIYQENEVGVKGKKWEK